MSRPRSMREIPATLVAIAVATAGACGSGSPRPVEIALDEDSCAHCRMAVSQREFAGQIVMPDGRRFFTDDVGCLGRWVAEHGPPPEAGVFVVDHATGAWLDARAASYLASEQLPTPMATGLAAFEGRAAAEGARTELGGRLLGWSELIAESGP